MVRAKYAPDDDSEIEEVSKDEKQAESEDEEGSGEEEEYEIEAILDAKHGAFPGGKLGYLVKWKNYDYQHNSWVNEDDAENAKDLIDAYWKQQTKAKRAAFGRKSDAKSNLSSAKKRKPSPSESETESARATKKRGRPPKVKSVSEDEEEIEAVPPPKAKTSRKSTGGSASAKKSKGLPEPMDEDEDTYQDMTKWKDAPSWAHLVDSIDTVERTPDGKLYVYFRLKSRGSSDGGLCREPSDLCRKKMPQLLLEFYERNLRWRPVEE